MSGALHFGRAVRFALPPQRCCNCGSIAGLRAAELAAPVPDGGVLPDRARRELLLDVSVCVSTACARSLKRQPPSWIVLAGIGMLAGLYAVAFARLAFGADALPLHYTTLAVFFGSGLVAALGWRWRQRPDPPQTSAFAPIRIRRLRHVGGEVRELALDFTQSDTARDFERAHAALIAASGLRVRVISGR